MRKDETDGGSGVTMRMTTTTTTTGEEAAGMSVPPPPPPPPPRHSRSFREAIREGSHLFNAGRKRECLDVYRAAAGEALSLRRGWAGDVGAEEDGGVGEILSMAALESDELAEAGRYHEGCWALRRCFDEIVAEESKSGDAVASETSSDLESLSELIRRAIAEGAPMYNDGRRRECYEVYASAVDAALAQTMLADSAVGEMLSQAAEEASQVVVAEGKDDDGGDDDDDKKYGEAAWVLRRCFDEISRREGDRPFMFRGRSDRCDGAGAQWQDEKVENRTDSEKGQALADTAYVLRASVTPRQHMRFATTYEDCFRASEAVEALTSLGLGRSRGEAAAKCALLLRAGLIVPVSHKREDAAAGEFRDGTHLYRFPSRGEVRASLDDLLLDEETQVDGTEKHVLMVALQAALELPTEPSEDGERGGGDSGNSHTDEASAPTFSGVSARHLRTDRRPSILLSPGHRRGHELAELAAKIEGVVDVADRSYRLKTYEQCFVGNDALTKITAAGLFPSRGEAAAAMDDLVRYGLVRHVTGEHGFKDAYLFYRFVPAAEIKAALDDMEVWRSATGGEEVEETVIRRVALVCRYKRFTGLNVSSILNSFYGCEDESGWDISDLDNWRNNMKRWGFGRREDQDDDMVRLLAPLALNVDPNAWDKTDDEEWESPWGIIAQIAIFDQIPRSAFRGTPEAFKWDDLAIRATKRALEKGYFETAYRSTLNQFVLLLPLEHSEEWEDQKLGVTLLLRLLSTVAVEDEGYSDYEIVKRLEFSKRLTTAFLEHAQVIAKFKRYPHRNRARGRSTTLEERLWLASDLVPRWAKSQNPQGGEQSKNIVKVPVIPLKRLTRR